jgi:RNA polymerase sigma factor (sigma-70 family)
MEMFSPENKGAFKFDNLSFDDLYRKHRNSSMNFMRRMIDNEDEILDVYQDAVIVLYNNSQRSDFQLTCSVQTYLNSICRNQVLKRIPNSRKLVRADDYEEGITDWMEEYDEERERKITAIESALLELESAKGPCFGLLRGFYFLKKKMSTLATDLGFANEDSAKNQKARCMKKLKEIVLRKFGEI